MRKFILTAFIAAVLPLSMAHAQSRCGDRETLTAQLGEKYGERLIAGGLAGTTQLLEIWTSPETGSWTLLVTEPGGRSCILAAGEDWVDFPAEALAMMGDVES